jgi:peptide deformylase
VELEPEDVEQNPAVAAFIAEVRHWRDVTGTSQKKLASQVRYTPSYVSKVERGKVLASRAFAEAADQHLRAGRAIIRRWKDMHDVLADLASEKAVHRTSDDDELPPPGPELVVEHEIAELVYRDGIYRTRVRRQLRNTGAQPVTQYLIRIAVDRYPGDPERSNQLYRHDPLTWDEVALVTSCGDEPMAWRVKHDRDASKEIWLLFENEDGKFPLYPGERAWISYEYSVSDHKWGLWWTRAIRLPTRRLSMTLVMPVALGPSVWGTSTSMTAESSPFSTPIAREAKGDEVTFSWSTEEPPLHARYRIEWKFRNPPARKDADMPATSAADQMRSLGIAQEGDPILSEVARPFDLPAEAEDARRVVANLVSGLDRVAQVHSFAKGMGLAAPQIGIGRAAAVIRTPDGETLTLLNPRICDESAETDEQYEGCLSFFDVRGKVPRPLVIEVEHTDIDGLVKITSFEKGLARLIGHEVDHLFGRLYRARMRPGVEPIPVSAYRGTGQDWTYR